MSPGVYVLMHKEKIVVVGLGYIGLPTALLFADSGKKVIGFDTDSKKIDEINCGKSPFDEPGLQDLLEKTLGNKSFQAAKELSPADVFIIAVPTPLMDLNQPDLSHVIDAVESIAPLLKPGNLVVIESTSPVGTTLKMQSLLSNLRADLFVAGSNEDQMCVLINMAYCSERAIPGNSLKEMVLNRRVIGGITERSSNVAKELYSAIVKGQLITADSRSAEMSKLVENTYRDLNIALANELSILCGDLKIDVNDVISLANGHPRVNILNPGIGVGGHCLAVDPWFLISEHEGYTKLIKQARVTNLYKTDWILSIIRRKIEEYLVSSDVECKQTVTISFLGLAYKPDSSDLRNSPALEICKKIVGEYDVMFRVVEPNIDQLPDMLSNVNCGLVDIRDGLESDLVFVLVKEMLNMNLGKVLAF